VLPGSRVKKASRLRLGKADTMTPLDLTKHAPRSPRVKSYEQPFGLLDKDDALAFSKQAMQ
jgi:hypothetical protein